MVIAVHEASEAASSSVGLGPVSVPPLSSGSSAIRRCSRISISCHSPCGGGVRASSPFLPRKRGFARRRHAPGEGEVGGAVEEAEDRLRGELLGALQLDHSALGAADRGAGDVERGGELGPAGDHELGGRSTWSM